MIMSTLSIILSAASLPVARAAPWRTLYARQSNGTNNNNNSGLSSSVWIPVVFIGGLFLLAAVWLLQRNMAGRRADPHEADITDGVGSAGQSRELTAADLAGGTRPARRQRRPRRTPSQVSTRSLPAYMKEPGDDEVVIYRGLEDMDEEMEGELQNTNNPTTMSTNLTLDTSRDSQDDSRSFLPPRTNSPELMRLNRASYDHQGSDDSHARLIDVQRGEAPAYDTIDLNPTEEPAPVYTPQNPHSLRMTGFFSRFMPHRGNNEAVYQPITLPPPSDSRNSTLSSSHSPSHSRGYSVQFGTSGPASPDSHDSPRGPRVGRTHRTRSSTGSVFTLFSKPVPRDHDDGQMTSPSMISLNSISSPLTHTATRTEFAFPRTGPTSEQVRFLSSKETFGRFSIPYGPDAVGFAASSSRPDLPPDFNAIHRSNINDLSPNADGGTVLDMGRSSSPRSISTGPGSDRGESPIPASAEPSQDLGYLTDQPPSSTLESDPNPEGDTFPSSLQNSLSKQKSAPNLGMGRPPLLKSVLKSKSVANIQSDGDGSLPPRNVSAAGSHLTVESFRTARDDGDGSVPSLPLGPLPHIMVQLPSNNPSLVNLAEGSGSDTEEFFIGQEAPGNHQNRHIHSDSGSRSESTAETHSGPTKVDKTLVATKATVEVSRTATIEA